MIITVTIDYDDETGTIKMSIPFERAPKGLIETIKNPEMKERFKEAFFRPLEDWFEEWTKE